MNRFASQLMDGRPGRLISFSLALLVACCASGPASAKPRSKPLPPFAKVREVVQRHFATLPDYRPGDIIAQGDVGPIFKQLRILGWSVTDHKGILRRVPKDGEYLVRQLRTGPGRKFMAQVSGYSLVYDRMERTIRLKGGQQLIHDVIRLPDGHKYLQVKPTPGFKNLAELLPKTASGKPPKGKDYDKPTGRIYTVRTLLQMLQQSYERTPKSRPGGEKPEA